ncbi:unnamed protein product [Dibothriocephalus latus]|uniref:Uncharacterized protein n=1 Tax=Dibothriocephalus latus TaxID=60516 RepID=A0A3P7MRL7_DIBLA|nr:unnamed protein product [Dibothriocephalus latus]
MKKRKYYGFHLSTIYKRIVRQRKAYDAEMGEPSLLPMSSVVNRSPELEMPELSPEISMNAEPAEISQAADTVGGRCFLIELQDFCLRAKLSPAAKKELFQILRPYHPELPKDADTNT